MPPEPARRTERPRWKEPEESPREILKPSVWEGLPNPERRGRTLLPFQWERRPFLKFSVWECFRRRDPGADSWGSRSFHGRLCHSGQPGPKPQPGLLPGPSGLPPPWQGHPVSGHPRKNQPGVWKLLPVLPVQRPALPVPLQPRCGQPLFPQPRAQLPRPPAPP